MKESLPVPDYSNDNLEDLEDLKLKDLKNMEASNDAIFSNESEELDYRVSKVGGFNLNKSQLEEVNEDASNDDFSDSEKEQLYHTIGLGALKYYILKVDPKKRILFNPEESVDFQGNTGPFIQYTYARIQSIVRKATAEDFESNIAMDIPLQDKEKELLKQLQLFPETIQLAADQYSPALIANYTYDLVRMYNSFFQNIPIFTADTMAEKRFRIQLSKATGDVIKTALGLLGIDVPNRM